MKNTVIFLQNKVSDEDEYISYCYRCCDVMFTSFDLKERLYVAKQYGYKFGFVIKSLKP